MQNTEAVEAVRAHYRPSRVTTLFVGESAPSSGAFFYRGNTAMLRNMRRYGPRRDDREDLRSYLEVIPIIFHREQVMETTKNRIMIFGPKSDGTYVVEFQDLRGRVARHLGAERRDCGAAALPGADALRLVRAGRGIN